MATQIEIQNALRILSQCTKFDEFTINFWGGDIVRLNDGEPGRTQDIAEELYKQSKGD